MSYPSYPGARGGGGGGGSRTSPASASYQGSALGTPLRGSQSSLTRLGADPTQAPMNIDESLINPADTTPTAFIDTPATPDEPKPYSLPGYQGPVSTNDAGKAGISTKFKGGLDKMKGLFKRGPKPPPQPTGIEDDDDTMGSQDYLDKIDEAEKVGLQKTLAKIQTLFKRNQQMAAPSLYQPGDKMIMKEPEPKSRVTFGNFVNVLLICGIVAGVIMCACIPAEPELYYIGPVILGLSIFALIGKLYFSCLHQEDPLPQSAKSLLGLYEKYLGGQKDPYKLNQPQSAKGSAPGVMIFYGPMSSDPQRDVTQMQTFSYAGAPRPASPKMYDESIDTRLSFAHNNLIQASAPKLKTRNTDILQQKHRNQDEHPPQQGSNNHSFEQEGPLAFSPAVSPTPEHSAQTPFFGAPPATASQPYTNRYSGYQSSAANTGGGGGGGTKLPAAWR